MEMEGCDCLCVCVCFCRLSTTIRASDYCLPAGAWHVINMLLRMCHPFTHHCVSPLLSSPSLSLSLTSFTFFFLPPHAYKHWGEKQPPPHPPETTPPPPSQNVHFEMTGFNCLGFQMIFSLWRYNISSGENQLLKCLPVWNWRWHKHIHPVSLLRISEGSVQSRSYWI